MVKRDERACPHCGKINDVHKYPHDSREPEAGDVSVCWNCMGIGVFAKTGVRKPTPDETERFANDPRIWSLVATMTVAASPDAVIEALRRTGSQ